MGFATLSTQRISCKAQHACLLCAEHSGGLAVALEFGNPKRASSSQLLVSEKVQITSNDSLTLQWACVPGAEQVESLAAAVEAVNPNKASLSSPLVNGKWRLLYTTSSSILGTSRPTFLRPAGDIFQTIGAPMHRRTAWSTVPFYQPICGTSYTSQAAAS